MDINGNAAAVINDRNAFVFVDAHFNFIAGAGQGFIDAVIHHFIDEVMQTPHRDIADIHRRAQPHRLQTLENLNLAGIVGGLIFSVVHIF